MPKSDVIFIKTGPMSGGLFGDSSPPPVVSVPANWSSHTPRRRPSRLRPQIDSHTRRRPAPARPRNYARHKPMWLGILPVWEVSLDDREFYFAPGAFKGITKKCLVFYDHDPYQAIGMASVREWGGRAIFEITPKCNANVQLNLTEMISAGQLGVSPGWDDDTASWGTDKNGFGYIRRFREGLAEISLTLRPAFAGSYVFFAPDHSADDDAAIEEAQEKFNLSVTRQSREERWEI